MNPLCVCVFAGSRGGVSTLLLDAATRLGEQLATRGMTLVYGAGGRGMMGALANGALAKSGQVIGVIPDSIVIREWAHTGLSELHVVADMHERKARMSALSDVFVALPGGIGTLEELFEMYTWAQLGFHAKPVALLNVHGFYEPLLAMLDQMTEQAFLSEPARALLQAHSDVDSLLDWLNTRASDGMAQTPRPTAP
jgi:uncharacterized protein (TIGR00730 family)